MYKIKFFMTDYMYLSKAEYECEDAIFDKLKPKYAYYDINSKKNKIKKLFIEDFLKQFNSLKAYGCDGEVKLNKPFKIRAYDHKNSEIIEKWNSDLFQTNTDYNTKEETITEIKGLVGTLHGTVEYNKTAFDVTLEIRSRFDKKNKPYFLWTMLSEALAGVPDSNEQETNLIPRGEDNDASMDIMAVITVLMFRKALNEAWQSGIYRTYVRREHNDDKLRGSIDVARHIKLNVGRNSASIAYSTRERTENNPMNQLILHAWAHIKREYPEAAELMSSFDSEDQAMFSTAIDTISDRVGLDIADVRTCLAQNQQAVSSPLYSKYEDLRKLCLDILRDDARGTVYSYGTGEQESGILFYIPDLWERFLENRIRKALTGSGIKTAAQDRLYYYSQRVNSQRVSEKEKILYGMQSRPDYVFYKEDKPFFILDAKFKKFQPFYFYSGKHISALNGEDAETKDARSKLYAPWEAAPAMSYGDDYSSADFDKVLRDMMVFGAHSGGVIYPISQELTDKLKAELKAKSDDDTFLSENFDDDGQLKKHFQNIKNASLTDPDLTAPHRISQHNSWNLFYNFPVTVPVPDAENNEMAKWKEAFDGNVNTVLKALRDVLTCKQTAGSTAPFQDM